MGAPCPGRSELCQHLPGFFYPLPTAIPTFHPSAFPSRRWGGGGWREEGSSGTIQRGLVMVTQRWPDSALFPAPLHPGLGFSSSFKSFFHHPLPFPSPSPCQDSFEPLHRCVLGAHILRYILGCGYQEVHLELLKSCFLPAPPVLQLCPRRTLV